MLASVFELETLIFWLVRKERSETRASIAWSAVERLFQAAYLIDS